ncbi:MAG: hypothetical protein V5B36_00950 [Candidatus Accumulibacter sp. UW25]|jgi:hypothetical protein
MKSFEIALDVGNLNSMTIPFSDYINVQVLLPNVAESPTLPADARFILFSSTADFYARVNGTASVPSTDVTDGSASEINPTIRSLLGVTSLSLIAPANCTVSLSFYK